MREELDKKLCAAYPNLYVRAGGSPFTQFGFECNDGWFDLIDRLSAELEAIIVAMPERERKQYHCLQCKEKFGTLRFYILYDEDGKMFEAIMRAEGRSAITCEECGGIGKLRERGWMKVRCDKCDKDYLESKNK